MILLPDSIRTRTVLTLLVGLTASHLASTALLPMGGPVGGGWSQGEIASALVMGVATIVFAWLASGWIVAPLAAFARAAETLGLDVAAPPLAENGPTEVRAAARAFNQMQTRIRSFVEDRLRMFAAISHDLRGPITRLKLRAEQLAVDSVIRDKMVADLDDMAAMVESSLAFARDEAREEKTEAIDVAAILASLCDDAADAGRRAEFAGEGRVVYRGRPVALKRMFGNLIDNALRYGDGVEVRVEHDASGLEIAVEDEGPGIPIERMEDVFRPFFRLETSRNKRTGGIGLGLATARSIARAHGGDIVLENRAERGLRARVVLPRQSAPGA
jgi:signal transduction histidine kinase